MSVKLIGFTGLKGAGKDTAASVLLRHGWTNVKFAGPLKDMLRTLLYCQGAPSDLIDRMIEGDLKETPSALLSGKTPRWAMQSLGTQWGRDLIDQEFWVDVTLRSIASLPGPVVITDVRFPNEAEAIAKAGGVLVRIDRPGLVAGDHASEALVQGLVVDFVIINDHPTADKFSASVACDLACIVWGEP